MSVDPSELSAMQAYYAARASEYDRIYLKPERQPDLRALQQWLPDLFRGTRLIEIACGTGYWTQFIAQAASEVLALDSAPETMAIARTRVPAEKVRFQVGDAYRLPRDQGDFDAAFAGFWFSHVPRDRQREFLQGLGTVLRPGARVVLLDNLFVQGSSTPISREDAEGNTYQTRSLDDGSSHEVLKNFPSAQELGQHIAGLGVQAEFRRFEYYWVFQYRAVAGG